MPYSSHPSFHLSSLHDALRYTYSAPLVTHMDRVGLSLSLFLHHRRHTRKMSLRLFACSFSCIVLASPLAYYFSPTHLLPAVLSLAFAPLRRRPWHSLAHCHTLYLDLSTLHTPQKKIQIVPPLVRCERHRCAHMKCAVLGCITRQENIEG
ncbi:hypothetical protein EV702DRAFT_776634 [Suillus placidus]|uniref:Transmembrane protein n=1 Tax=Suillus placidus TaxID=48579 RepID=A0A9P7D5P0_9AGAM|nr:hypothetical protein EV702DRAFT_776634 [Suillus placidus]